MEYGISNADAELEIQLISDTFGGSREEMLKDVNPAKKPVLVD